MATDGSGRFRWLGADVATSATRYRVLGRRPQTQELRASHAAGGATSSRASADARIGTADMSSVRPIGHVAAALSVVAVSISHWIKHSHADAVLVCWRSADASLYLHQASHPAARPIGRTAPPLADHRC